MADLAPVSAFDYRDDWTVRWGERKRHDKWVRERIRKAPTDHHKRFVKRPILDHEGPEPNTVSLSGSIGGKLVANIYGQYVGGAEAASRRPADTQDPSGNARVSKYAHPSVAGLRGATEGDAWTGNGVGGHPEVRRSLRGSKQGPMVRFARLVSIDGDCQLWTGSTSSGYGRFRVDGRTVQAHRWRWELDNGPIPAKHALRQSCGNRACVAMAHLHLDPLIGSVSQTNVRETPVAIA